MSALANGNSRGMLVPIDGADEGDRIPLLLGITNIGSGPAMDVVADSPGISYLHAFIRGDRNGYWLQDFQSRKGTWVNGERIGGEGRPLRNLDRVTLGGRDGPVSWVYIESQDTEELPRLRDASVKGP